MEDNINMKNKFTVTIIALFTIAFLAGCASMKASMDAMGKSYAVNPTGVRHNQITEQLDPLLGLEMDAVKTYVPKAMRQGSTLILHEEVVDPNYPEFSWSSSRPFFYPEDTVKSVLAEKGKYDILIYNTNLRVVSNQRGYNYYGLAKEQRRNLNLERRDKWGRYMLFERLQLTFRNGKLMHWHWQAVL